MKTNGGLQIFEDTLNELHAVSIPILQLNFNLMTLSHKKINDFLSDKLAKYKTLNNPYKVFFLKWKFF